MQIFAIVVSLTIALVGIALFTRAIMSMVATIRIGQPALGRSDHKATRWATMLKETLAHTRMLQWTAVGIGHWFVFIGFGLLFFTLVTAFGQLFDPHFVLPVIGGFFLYEWFSEFFTVVMVIAISAFIYYRATRPKERERGPRGRFYGSTMWQGYFVELVILGVGLCILTLRGAEHAIAQYGEHPEHASAFHFPFTAWLGGLLGGLPEATLANLIFGVATLKIVISFTWMIVLSQNTTMGVAWHRFTAWFNIWFKRRADGGTALGALQPMTAGGKVVDFEDLEEMDEDTVLGVGKVEDFSWKGILDFTSCTECGRCQSQCPAWHTDKPLSPKLLITQLRDHAYAKAPYLLASSEEERTELPASVLTEAERPLVGETEGWAWQPDGGAVIDPDVLWSCTSCGACVQQCPVDIEHVDHIVDMRRYQVLVESNFPAELNGLFKGLENKGNPWNMSPKARMEWAQGLDFDVKVVGEDVESLDEVDWLFWVGCAGAYEDRAKKTTRAVAELLDMAGVSFAVLGNGETCSGDPARRAGNEFVFQGLAAQNAETFKEMKVKKVVSTCAHCFNTLKNEYSQFGVELEVVHHTQLLNRLVREGKLTPVATNGTAKRSLTYHDPCYLGRHNQVYSPPRELLDVIPDATVTEMPRNSERSFCCGAGGARMWMEERIGERINLNRTAEAVETGADQIATGCPFCRVMLSDGLTAKQADGSAREEVEVLDVAQLLLASVKGETRAPVPAGATARAAAPASAGGGAAAATGATEAATKAEPSADDVTQTDSTVTSPEDVGANAAATAERTAPSTTGGSLFDTPADSEEAEPSAPSEPSVPSEPSEPSAAEEPAGPSSGGSLFDVAPSEPESEPTTQEKAQDKARPESAKPEPEAKAQPEAAEPEAAEPEAAEPEAAEPEAAEAEAKPADEGLSSGGSLFDIAPSEPEPKTEEETEAKAESAEAEPEASSEPEPAPGETGAPPAATPASDAGTISEAGSLFDIAPSEPQAKAEPEAPSEPEAEPTAKAEATGAEPEAPNEPEAESAAKAEPEPEPKNDSAAEPERSRPQDESDAEPERPAEPEPEGTESKDAESKDAESKDAESKDEPHQPKKGGINEGGSLFDL